MSITIIAYNQDGTYLGADEKGVLYTGAIERFGFDEITREVISDDGERVVYQDTFQGELISQGDVEKVNFSDGAHDKVMVDTHDENGIVTGQVEKKMALTVWKKK